MADDPFTLIVCLDRQESATGQLYFDDGLTFNYNNSKEFVYREFKFTKNKLISK